MTMQCRELLGDIDIQPGVLISMIQPTLDKIDLEYTVSKKKLKQGRGKPSKGKQKKKTPLKNITINIPDIYDENIQKLIALKVIPSRSEAVRMALRDFLHKEYDNLQLLNLEIDDGDNKDL